MINIWLVLTFVLFSFSITPFFPDVTRFGGIFFSDPFLELGTFNSSLTAKKEVSTKIKNNLIDLFTETE